MSKPSATKKRREMGEVSRMTKTPTEIECKGETYLIAPLEVSDLGKLETWVSELPLRKAKRQIEVLGDSLTPEIKEKILNEAIEKSNNQIDISSEKAQAALESLAGVGYLLFLSLRKNHPEIKENEAIDLISMDTLKDVKDKLDLSNSLFPTIPRVKKGRK